VTPTGFAHGAVTSRVATLLRLLWMGTGWVKSSARKPASGLIPTRCAGRTALTSAGTSGVAVEPDKYVPFAPDLAVEVVSPGDTASDIRDKVDLYRIAGTRLVWVIYRNCAKSMVFARPDRPQAGAEGVLDGGDVLPGLQIKVAESVPTP